MQILKQTLFFFLTLFPLAWLMAELRTPAVIGNHMVLQQNHLNPIWGWDKPNTAIEVKISGQSHKTVSDTKGYWRVTLSPMKASTSPKVMSIQGSSSLTYENILVGEVWLCSGQSNMGWNLGQADDKDLESLGANFPHLRIISIPQVGTQEPQNDFKGKWDEVSPGSAIDFSAVGFLFGRRLHQVLRVPVGLIDNAWGGSACEAWIPRDRLNRLGVAKPYIDQWKKTEAHYDFEKLQTAYKEKLQAWQNRQIAARKAGKVATEIRPRAPRNQMTGQHRPANLYNGVLHPIIGYGIKGTIWYQGESNADRAHAYREVFPLMIQSWRDAWKQGDFSFYWVQLADYREEMKDPVPENWPELREAQTMTLDKLKNVGEAVIIDTGEGRDIHPRNKQTVANRLARHALARDYGYDIPHQSPRYQSMKVVGNKIILSFDHVGAGLYCFDTTQPQGFAICGKDQKFVWGHAKLKGKNSVEVWSEEIEDPVAVRYAWMNNPACNLYRRDGSVTLPVTPFRTDDFPMITAGQ
jgi:sialate O-acetylesterase